MHIFFSTIMNGENKDMMAIVQLNSEHILSKKKYKILIFQYNQVWCSVWCSLTNSFPPKNICHAEVPCIGSSVIQILKND